jgi:DUF971 family protein
MTAPHPLPIEITLRKTSRLLVVAFEDGCSFELPYEYLRVHSPSAEVRGHHGIGGRLQVGKEEVIVEEVRPVGNYAVKILFDDGHRSGLYTWRYLYELGSRKEQYWRDYLSRLAEAGHVRRA